MMKGTGYYVRTEHGVIEVEAEAEAVADAHFTGVAIYAEGMRVSQVGFNELTKSLSVYIWDNSEDDFHAKYMKPLPMLK